MKPTVLEIIARTLCSFAGVDPDEITGGGPAWFAMRAQALSIENALRNAGYVIVSDTGTPQA